MTIFTLLCLFTYLGDVPTQTSILDYGQGGEKLPTLLGTKPGRDFFESDLDHFQLVESEYTLTFELAYQRQKAKVFTKKGTTENLRIYNPNNFDIDVVIMARRAAGFKNFLVRVESHFVVDLNLDGLGQFEILDLACMMPFEADLQYFGKGDGEKLQSTVLRSEVPLGNRLRGEIKNQHLANKGGEMETCPQPAYPLYLTSDDLKCSPDPSVDDCHVGPGSSDPKTYDYSFACCPANQFCTEDDLTRWVDMGNFIAKAVRRYVRPRFVNATELIPCDGPLITPDWSVKEYELDFYWPTSQSLMLAGQGGGNWAGNAEYPCLQRTYVVEDGNGKIYNVRGENGMQNADDVLFGEAWGYHREGKIICTSANNCPEDEMGDPVLYIFKTIALPTIADQSIHWGNVNIGASEDMDLIITTYHKPYSGVLTLSGDSDFSFSTGSSISINMAEASTLSIPITFAPSSGENKFAIVTIPGVDDVYLDGKGIANTLPDPTPFSAWPTSHNFGYQALNHSETFLFQVTNNETQTIQANVTLAGSNMFSLVQGEGTHTFSQGQTKTFTVNYTPTAQGTYQGVLKFSVNGYEDLQINVSGNTTAGGTPELAVGTVLLSKSSVSPGETVNVSYTVTNNSQDVARYWRDQIHLSTNGTLAGATQLWESNSYNFDFNPSAVMSQTITVTIPANAQTGSYQIIVFTDARDIYAENNENDNTASASISVVPAN